MRELEKGDKPLEMKIDNSLCYFLMDDGDKEGGMFLASAYENFIKWQNFLFQNAYFQPMRKKLVAKIGESGTKFGKNASYACTTILLYFSLGSPMMRI